MKKAKKNSWTQEVMETSFALDLESGVFTFDDPCRIAQSLKESAERSTQRKTGLFNLQCPCLTITSIGLVQNYQVSEKNG